MRLKVTISIFFTVILTSCFMGAETYEKSVNDYFHLYSDTYKTDNVCLGTIEYSKYRLGNSYLCSIIEIGWDNSFLVVLTKGGTYYIQDLRPLKGKSSEEFKNYLLGPFTKERFAQSRDSLGVDKDLDFKISY
jgi:hypothetical protein